MKRLLLTTLVVAGALAGASPVIGASGGGAVEPLFGTAPTDPRVAIGRSHERAILSAGALAPGTPVHGRIRIWNAGDVAARFSLSAAPAGQGPLADALRLRVTSDGALVYEGPLSGLAGADLGTLAPGEGVTVRIRALLPPEAATRDLHGQTLTADFTWTATQA